MEFMPVNQFLEENKYFAEHPDCQDSIQMTIDFYKKVGFNPPWIGYYAAIDGVLVGCAAFKGKPVNNEVEIAYGVFPRFQNQGIGAEICHELIALSKKTDPSIVIIARTWPEENYSTKILRSNQFQFRGKVLDPEDGEVWDWVYMGK